MASFETTGLTVNTGLANGLQIELSKLRDIGATKTNIVYSPLILNTILIMIYLNQEFGNLFIPMEVAPYGGYQLTLDIDHTASETAQDKTANENVNRLVSGFMRTGKDKIAVSLMFIDPSNQANNHANAILFLKVSEDWHVYHYEPYGSTLVNTFPDWFETSVVCINSILQKIGILPENIKTHNKTRINQSFIERLQNQLTEGGYCQMISALQSYLFLLFDIVNLGDPNNMTPLGSSLISPKNGNSEITLSFSEAEQLQIIRGFVIYISSKINSLLFSSKINFDINHISEINQYYAAEQVRTGRYRPVYLYYLDAAIKFITAEVATGSIKLNQTCSKDCGPITVEDVEDVEDFGELNAQVTPLLGLLNGAVVLTKAAKMEIFNKFLLASRVAATATATRAATATATRAATATATARTASKKPQETITKRKGKGKKYSSTRKYKKQVQGYKRRKTKKRKTRK
jgi:hypothetical protein